MDVKSLLRYPNVCNANSLVEQAVGLVEMEAMQVEIIGAH